MSEPSLPYVLHITERALWDAARERGTYEMSTRGRTLREEGFIHCSTRDQLPRVAAFLYGSYDGPDDLVVLVVDPARLDVPLKYEAPEPGGEEFPHVYGPIPVTAVVDVEAWGVSRRVWRWAVLVWVVTVAVGGALTVWLQDSAEPPRTPASHGTDDSGPAPVVGRNGDDLKDLAGMCSATPGASPTPAEASGVIVVCLRETPRP